MCPFTAIKCPFTAIYIPKYFLFSIHEILSLIIPDNMISSNLLYYRIHKSHLLVCEIYLSFSKGRLQKYSSLGTSSLILRHPPPPDELGTLILFSSNPQFCMLYNNKILDEPIFSIKLFSTNKIANHLIFRIFKILIYNKIENSPTDV